MAAIPGAATPFSRTTLSAKLLIALSLEVRVELSVELVVWREVAAHRRGRPRPGRPARVVRGTRKRRGADRCAGAAATERRAAERRAAERRATERRGAGERWGAERRAAERKGAGERCGAATVRCVPASKPPLGCRLEDAV